MKREFILSHKREKCLAGGLAFLLTLMQIDGWQRSVKYGTSVHTFWIPFVLGESGVLSVLQCVLFGIVEWCVFSLLFYSLFSCLERKEKEEKQHCCRDVKYFWLIAAGLIYFIYIIYLIGCYPGFYNYDVGAQIVQVLYDEVPYNAHHPLLHTLLEGGIIALGYSITKVNLKFGVFLFCLFQMGVCALSFGYSIQFIYKHTHRWILGVLAAIFYAICPPIVMFAMSTTKDTLCYALLLPALLKLHDIYRDRTEGRPVKRKDWVIAGCLLLLSCLFRNNIIYGLIVLALFTVIFRRRNFKWQAGFLISVIVLYFCINGCLIKITKAEPGALAEALSVPLQQIARLYAEKGTDAFTLDEQKLLFAAAEPEMLATYDPMIADGIKYTFWRHWDVIMDHKWEYVSLWCRKGFQYPKIYIDAFLDNTYQAWYPGTLLMDRKGYRYFNITDWQEEFGNPRIPGLYEYYKSICLEGSYRKYPVLRLFFSIGAMLWITMIAWFYGLWRRDGSTSWILLLLLTVCATCLFGPVSDVRYYLILFFMLPVNVSFLFGSENIRNGSKGNE